MRLRLRSVDPRHRDRDEGFVLLESIISISIIVIVMTGLTTFFVNVTGVTNELRAKQGAVAVADGMIDQIRALKPSDTYAGRTASAVSAQFATAPAQVVPLLSGMTQVSDNSGSTAKLAMSSTPAAINGISYSATNYLGTCLLPLSATDGTDCDVTYGNSVAAANFIRVVLAVTWPDSHCPARTCAYVTSTLLSNDADPNFLLNQTPPAAPIITDPGAQTSAINDSITLQMALNVNTGVPPITWSTPPQGQIGALPAGLSISTDGLITGTATGPVNSLGLPQTVVTAVDGFGRSDGQSITWKILADVIPSGPATWAGPINTSISQITLSATGGSGSPYTWSVPASGQPGGLPPGLSLTSAGVISGSPSTAGSYASTITVKDSSGRARTLSTTWTVYPLPTVAMSASTYRIVQNWTIARQQVAYTCPTSTCTLTLSNAPTGVGLSTTATGAASATLNVTAASGTVFLAGTVTGAANNYGLSLAITDTTYSKSGTPATATWTVAAPGTAFAGPSVTRGTAIPTQNLNYSCASACTISFAGALAVTPFTALTGTWLAPDVSATATTATLTKAAGTATFYVRGTPSTANAAGSYKVSITVTDASGSSSTTSVTWTLR